MDKKKRLANPSLHYGLIILICLVGILTLIGLTYDHLFTHQQMTHPQKPAMIMK